MCFEGGEGDREALSLDVVERLRLLVFERERLLLLSLSRSRLLRSWERDRLLRGERVLFRLRLSLIPAAFGVKMALESLVQKKVD